MTLLSGLWNSLTGNKTSRSSIPLKGSRGFSAQTTVAKHTAEPKHSTAKAVAKKIIQPIASSCMNSLEKRKLVSTRAQLESESTSHKLTLGHLRSRIDAESEQYLALRQRQQQSMSHWFGQPAAVIDEAALTERLSTQTGSHSLYSSSQILAQISSGTVETYCDVLGETFSEVQDSTLNFSDIHLPNYYDNQLIEAGGDFDLGLDFDLTGENLEGLPPLLALGDDIPELEELLARLQIVESLETVENEVLESKELHLVAPFVETVADESSNDNAPVEMVKHRSKGKKGRRRNKGQTRDAVKNKSAAMA